MTGVEMMYIKIQGSVHYQPRCETINDRFRDDVYKDTRQCPLPTKM